MHVVSGPRVLCYLLWCPSWCAKYDSDPDSPGRCGLSWCRLQSAAPCVFRAIRIRIARPIRRAGPRPQEMTKRVREAKVPVEVAGMAVYAVNTKMMPALVYPLQVAIVKDTAMQHWGMQLREAVRSALSRTLTMPPAGTDVLPPSGGGGTTHAATRGRCERGQGNNRCAGQKCCELHERGKRRASSAGRGGGGSMAEIWQGPDTRAHKRESGDVRGVTVHASETGLHRGGDEDGGGTQTG